MTLSTTRRTIAPLATGAVLLMGLHVLPRHAHALPTEVHGLITYEAAQLPGVPDEVRQAQWLGDWNSHFGGSPTTICQGSVDEDWDREPWKDPSTEAWQGLRNWGSHFWKPDEGPNSGLLLRLPCVPPGFNINKEGHNAYTRGESLFYEAVRQYRANNHDSAYYLLGQVAHLLEDMGTPAHVQLDVHLPIPGLPGDCNNDSYETYMKEYEPSEGGTLNKFRADFTDGRSLSPINISSLPGQGTPVYKLFFSMATYAAQFDSDDVDGTVFKGTTRQYIPLSSIYYINEQDCRIYAGILIPETIEHIAALYRLFWEETQPNSTEPIIGSITAAPDPVTQGHLLTLTANDVVGVGGASIQKVVLYRGAGVGFYEELGSDTNPAGGWSLTLPVSWSAGWHRYYARAQDTYSNWSSFGVSATGEVVSPAPPSAKPELSNPRVTPSTGTTSTTFSFLVDYYHPDGVPPHADYRQVLIAGGHGGTMTLYSGTASNGTYRYRTELPIGSYQYWFFFADQNYNMVETSAQVGPGVYGEGEVPITVHAHVNGGPLSPCIKFRSWNWGDSIDVPLDVGEFTYSVPAGAEVWFSTEVCCATFECESSSLYVNGSHVGTGTCTRWFQLGPTAESVDLHLYFKYRNDITYTLSGTVLLDGGGLVPGGVDVTLSSPVQNETLHTTNGNFSFAAKGGVTVSLAFAAGGHGFSPSGMAFPNLCQHQTGLEVRAFSWDTAPPSVTITGAPAAVGEDAGVTFTWTGSDDLTPTNNLEYQYRLDPLDSAWSTWTAATSRQYQLPNGEYTFWLRARDQAGNYTGSPSGTEGIDSKHNFIVNAAPKLVSTERTDRSVWASRLRLENPASSGVSGDIFVLLPSHAAAGESDLVPVAVYTPENGALLGALEQIAGELAVPSLLARGQAGCLFTLPQSLSPGQSRDYDIVWGKIAYFGWQEAVRVPRCLPSYQKHSPWVGVSVASHLDSSFRMWRTLSRMHIERFGYESSAWLSMSIADSQHAILPERQIGFLPGRGYDGSYGEGFEYLEGKTIAVGNGVCNLWRAEKRSREGSGSNSIDRTFRGYGLEICDQSGSTLSSFEGDFIENAQHFVLPREAIQNRIYVLGDTSGSTSTSLWYAGHDSQGRIVTPMTTIESVPRPHYVRSQFVLGCGPNVMLIWNESWETPSPYWKDRERIRYQVRNVSGGIVVPTTTLHDPLLPDSQDEDDQYQIYDIPLMDNEGNVWIHFERDGGPWSQRYYVVIGSDGLVRGPAQPSDGREFIHCDRDGYVWSFEGDKVLLFSPGGTPIASSERQLDRWWVPNARVGELSASVGGTGDAYRLYDRWSDARVVVQVSSSAVPAQVELFNLDVWNNGLLVSDVDLELNSVAAGSFPGVLPARQVVDVDGQMSEGANLLTLSQGDLYGGQILVTFPYVVSYELSVSAAPEINVPINLGPGQSLDTPFARQYDAGSVATVTAPQTHDGYAFSRWRLDGTGQTAGQRTLNVTMDADRSAVAVYSCTYSISPDKASFGEAGGSGSIGVTAADDCAWTAANTPAWVTITSGSSGNGDGTVHYTVAANSNTSVRTGTITAAGKTHTITQAGTPPPPEPDCLANADCEDGNLCTIDACEGGVCVSSPRDCGAGFCQPATGACVDCMTGADCDDDNLCTVDACAEGACVNTPKDCAGGVCDPATGRCMDCLSDADCEDGNLCTADACVGGACTHAAVDCGDDVCDPETGECVPAVECVVPADCPVPADLCSVAVCESNVCGEVAKDCGEGLCNPTTGECVVCLIDADCADGDLCTDDACAAGACVFAPVVCDDTDPCTDDVCDPDTGECVSTAIGCDDEDLCTIDECVDGECAFTPIICDDGNPCTDDACVDGECVFTAVVCDDGDLCTVDGCVGGECVNEPVDCGEGFCDPDTGECLDCLVDADCDDGQFCNGAEVCTAGECLVGDSPCDAYEFCFEDEGRCAECIANVNCDDGLFCNGVEACLDGFCVAGTPPCDESEICFEDEKDCVAGTFTLTVGIMPPRGAEGGAPAPVSHPAYTSIPVWAPTAAPGFRFTDWSGDASGSSNPIMVPMDRDKAITANYELIPVPPPVCFAASPATLSLTVFGLMALRLANRRRRGGG